MTNFIVRITRTETIDFVVEADNEEDAQSRYLMDGNEVASSTERLEVLNVMTHDEWEQEGAPTMRQDSDGNVRTRL